MSGAGDRSRTGDLVLGRHPLCQLSYSRGPGKEMVGATGFEPATSASQTPRATSAPRPGCAVSIERPMGRVNRAAATGRRCGGARCPPGRRRSPTRTGRTSVRHPRPRRTVRDSAVVESATIRPTVARLASDLPAPAVGQDRQIRPALAAPARRWSPSPGRVGCRHPPAAGTRSARRTGAPRRPWRRPPPPAPRSGG